MGNANSVSWAYNDRRKRYEPKLKGAQKKKKSVWIQDPHRLETWNEYNARLEEARQKKKYAK